MRERVKNWLLELGVGIKTGKSKHRTETEIFQNFGFGILVFGSVFGLFFCIFGISVRFSVYITLEFGISV